jgi:signal transduction histidine kinase/ActR/RegA family two-component response regulator
LRNVIISGKTIEKNILAIFVDVTDQKRAIREKKNLEVKLRQAQKMEAIGTLAGGIAHDFNNILSAIMGYAELAREDRDRPDDLLHDIGEVLVGANRAKTLVKQILTFSRKSEQQFQPIKVQMIIKETLELLRPSLPTTIEIKQNIDQECEAVLADSTQIHQLIMNLCTNAYHAMKKNGGVLALSLKRVFLFKKEIDPDMDIEPGLYLKLEVSDTGIGMHKKVLETIFEPYFTTKDKGEGTGLGLAVVHGIVADFNGSIGVDSEPGRGTIFTIYLPVIETEKELSMKKEMKIPLPTGNEHILVVDDDEVLVNLNKKFLEKLGYKVTGFTSSLEALQVFKETANNFDLLVTDMTMPEMTGAQLSQEILLIKPYFPIILCTGFSELITEEKASQLGILDYIMKPVAQKDLAVSIRRLLDVA